MTMKLRNRLIALGCLILFLAVAGGVLFLGGASKKPFAVILFVGDNLSPSALTAARLFSGGGEARLQMEDFPNTALCRNAANDYSVPESASASTAIASGKRVNKGCLGIAPSGEKLPSLLETASSRGRSTGLITTGRITGPTAAAYFAKTLDGSNREAIARQYAEQMPMDLVIGGGAEDFEDTAPKEGKTGSSESSGKLFAGKGVQIVKSAAELESQPFWKKTPLLALLSNGPLLPAQQQAGDGTSPIPSLSELVRVAIRKLQSDRQGYLLVVDDPMIGDAALSNDGEKMLQRIVDFDHAVATARRYAGDHSLIVVAGRETIGGLQLNGYPFLRDKGVAILALNAQGYPSLCWSTGPGFSMEPPSRPRKGFSSQPGILAQPSAFPLPYAMGVAGDVLAIGTGEGSEKIHGFLDLTDLHALLEQSL